jgi:hypothetical protein
MINLFFSKKKIQDDATRAIVWAANTFPHLHDPLSSLAAKYNVVMLCYHARQCLPAFPLTSLAHCKKFFYIYFALIFKKNGRPKNFEKYTSGIIPPCGTTLGWRQRSAVLPGAARFLPPWGTATGILAPLPTAAASPLYKGATAAAAGPPPSKPSAFNPSKHF